MQGAAIHLPDGYSLRLMSERDYAEISAICAAVYPSETSYTREELASHHTVFPEGQFVVVHDESLVDRVIPHVATRQWVLTVPWKRRWRHAELADGVLRIALRCIERWYRKATGKKEGKVAQ